MEYRPKRRKESDRKPSPPGGRTLGGHPSVYPRYQGVGVMKDEDPKLEEIESSHTLGGDVFVNPKRFEFTITDKVNDRRGGRKVSVL